MYLQSSGQKLCNNYVGYVAPTSIQISTATSTPPLRVVTVTRTSTISSTTPVVTTFAAAAVKANRFRPTDNSITEVTDEVIVDPYEISIVAIQTILPEDDSSMPKLNASMSAILNADRLQKRATTITTPASVAAWPSSKISAACSQTATGVTTVTTTITTMAASPLSTAEIVAFQTVVVAASTCTIPAPRPTAPSYIESAAVRPRMVCPWFPALATDPGTTSNLLSLCPFAVRIFDASSTQITLGVRGWIKVGAYQFKIFADELYVYGPGWNEGIFYRVERPIGSRKIHFSWFTSSYPYGHERFHVTATIDEAKPGILVSKVYDTWGQATPWRTISVQGNGKKHPVCAR
jgi:hypothetical protein